MDGLALSLQRCPELFPYAYDVRNDAVSLIRLTRADYERASFLDERVLEPHTLARSVPWEHLSAVVEGATLVERCHYIFHTGHVGSTLLSRLLGAHESVFSLREPGILRTLAQMRTEPDSQPRVWTDGQIEERLSAFLKLLSRTFEPRQSPVIKATSYMSELAPQLLSRPTAPKALLMFVKPETYLATILGGPNTRQEAKMLTAGRLKRLHRRLGREVWRLASFSEGEGLAAGWAAEMSALVEARAATGTRTLALDFDAFLEEPEKMLLATFRFLCCDATPEAAGEIIVGPLMQRYSKGLEHAYSPALRREILDGARKTNGAEIAKGLAWLDRAAEEFPLIRQCLAMAGR